MKRASKRVKRAKKIANALTLAGHLFVGISIVIVLIIYTPLLKVELRYSLQENSNEILPINTEFGIVIPKIQANAEIIQDVNPYDSRVYQNALTQGVAHAKGTSIPGAPGNIFLFSHSSANILDATKYNSVFYLLNKMEPGDVIDIYYKYSKFEYEVREVKIVRADEISYMEQPNRYEETLTLMTCWPAGTTFKRLLVIAKRT